MVYRHTKAKNNYFKNLPYICIQILVTNNKKIRLEKTNDKLIKNFSSSKYLVKMPNKGRCFLFYQNEVLVLLSKKNIRFYFVFEPRGLLERHPRLEKAQRGENDMQIRLAPNWTKCCIVYFCKTSQCGDVKFRS